MLFFVRMLANSTKPCSKIPSFSSLFFLLTSGLATTMANDKRHVKHSGCLPRYERVAKKRKVFAHSYENDTKRIFRLWFTPGFRTLIMQICNYGVGHYQIIIIQIHLICSITVNETLSWLYDSFDRYMICNIYLCKTLFTI